MKLKYSSITNVLVWIHILMWILIIPVTEFQLIWFGKKLITVYTLGIIEFVFFTLQLILLSRKKMKLNPVIKICIGYVISMIALWFIGFLVNSNTPLYWKFYYVFFWIMPVLIVIVSNPVRLNYTAILRVVAIIAIINAILVLWQHYSNSLIWPFETDDQGKTLFYISSGYYNTKAMIRCPGLCMSGLDSGALMIFGLLCVYLDEKLKLWKKIAFCALIVFAVWFTGTRNIYLLLAFVIGLIVINERVKNKNRIKVSMVYTIFTSILSFLLQFNLGVITQTATRNLITDFTSMNARFLIWSNIIADFDSGTVLQQLFGRSVWQSAGYSSVIDNMYLELLIMGGLVGLILVCWFIVKLSIVAIKSGENKATIFASYLLGLFVYGTLNVMGSVNLTFIMVIAMVLSQSIGGRKT